MSQKEVLNKILKKKRLRLSLSDIRETLEIDPPVRTTQDGSLLPVKTVFDRNRKASKIIIKDKDNGGYYDPDNYPYITYIVCREGFTQKKLALLFFVDISIIQKWLLKYPELRKAYEMGKDEHDSLLLEQTLLQRAKGGITIEVTSDGKGKTLKKVEKEYLPSVRALELFLRNRNPNRWNNDKETTQAPAQ